jgi:excisionase family DNA binding protein
MADDERLLTPEEVADRLKFAVSTVVDQMRAGRIPAFKFGRLWRVREGDLNAYIKQLASDGREHRREAARLGGLALKARREGAAKGTAVHAANAKARREAAAKGGETQ